MAAAASIVSPIRSPIRSPLTLTLAGGGEPVARPPIHALRPLPSTLLYTQLTCGVGSDGACVLGCSSPSHLADGNAENITADGKANVMADGTMEAVYFGSGCKDDAHGCAFAPTHTRA